MRLYFPVLALAVAASAHTAYGWRLEASRSSDILAHPQTDAIQAKRDGVERKGTERAVVDVSSTMQARFFSQTAGTWPDSNDWTSSVAQTHIAAVMKMLSRVDLDEEKYFSDPAVLGRENTVNGHFAHLVSFYYAQNAFEIMQQAHDDMLWLVLGWLELIRTTRVHSALRWEDQDQSDHKTKWHGYQYMPTFAHRARIFYDIVDDAWDEKLCGGGLTWNPKLDTYKNTVTNTLFMSAAADVYLYHPGDKDASPFHKSSSIGVKQSNSNFEEPNPLDPHDLRLLQRAIEAHDWLEAVDMRDKHGLYVDGYHISPDKRRGPSTPDQCDVRNEMLYTYNQGIILSGLRSLWEATGNTSYLTEGHELIQNVVRATGWREQPEMFSDLSSRDQNSQPDILSYLLDSGSRAKALESLQSHDLKWHALGRAGILHEFCDVNGDCNQDAQAFKGIFFHHLAAFCTPLPQSTKDIEFVAGVSHVADKESAMLHRNGCRDYAPWVFANARAAYNTRDEDGIMAGWWGQGIGDDATSNPRRLPVGAVDIVNLDQESSAPPNLSGSEQNVLKSAQNDDPNDRGRGRTLETHMSGVAVMRCLWEFVPLLLEKISA